MKTLNLTIAVLILLTACKPKQYALRDFDSPLKEKLEQIVNVNVAFAFEDVEAFLRSEATDKELRKMVNCEHPIIRMEGVAALLNRHPNELYSLLISHLDDTAYVTRMTHYGEKTSTTADYLFDRWNYDTSKENTSKEKELVDEILTKHANLRSAYLIAGDLTPLEKYYPIIKKMAATERYPFYEQELALYGLARFKKPEDIPFIKAILIKKSQDIGQYSFKLLKDFPAPEYAEFFNKYFVGEFYNKFSHFAQHDDLSEVLHTLASYKNKKSASLLDSILNNRPPYPFNRSNKEYLEAIQQATRQAIWDNQCSAYQYLMPRVKHFIKIDTSFNMVIEIPPSTGRTPFGLTLSDWW